MKTLPIVLITFGIILIVFPDIVGYILGGLFLFIGFNMLFFSKIFFGKKGNKEDYVKFGKYKIFR